MKKLISGRIYNTETATEIHTWENRYGQSDFNWCRETLYRTKKGNWFLFGESGPMGPYSVPVGNNGQGYGESIKPFNESEAVEWLESVQAIDEIEELFPDHIEEA